MVFQFKNKHKSEVTGDHGRQERLARIIVGHCLRWQAKWAAWMQSKTESLSNTGRAVVLILFCLMAGAYCLHLVLSGFATL
jgi:hypothetical protein